MRQSPRILAVDTATRCCSVAVRDGDHTAAEISVVSQRTHSVHLLGMVREALRLAALDLRQIDALAVSIGPGSFTGLRIGISTVQGLAFAGEKPCVGVSSLAALACGCLPWPHAVCALMDARRGEVYFGLYREHGDQPERLAPEGVMGIEEALHPADAPRLFVGDGADRHRDRIRAAFGERAAFAPSERNYPRAGILARLAQRLIEGGQGVDPERLAPRYLRQTDAELRLCAARAKLSATD